MKMKSYSGWLLLLLLSTSSAWATSTESKLLQAEELRNQDPNKVRQLLIEIDAEVDQLNNSSRLRHLHLKAHNLASLLDFSAATSILETIEINADTNNKIKALVLRSEIEAKRSNYYESLQALRQAISLLAKVTDADSRFHVYALAATLMAKNGAYEQAKDYVTEAFSLAKTSGQAAWQCQALYSMSLINRSLDQPELLLQNATEQQNICKKIDHVKYCDALESLAIAHQHLGQHSLAENYFSQGISCHQNNNWQPESASIKINYAAYLLQRKETTKSKALLADAIPILDKAAYIKPLSQGYALLADIAENENDLPQALANYRRHMQLELSLLDKNRQRELIFNQVKFEVERNKQEELRLQRENQLLAQQAEDENRRHHLIRWAFLISGALSTLLLLTLHRLYKQRGQLRYLAENDALTGCYNRHHAVQLAEKLHAFCARRRAPIAILMVDLDHFKIINDNFGQTTGDAVLHAVGRTLGQQLRQQDVIGRYGGDKFLILLADSDRFAAETVINRCWSALTKMVINTPYQLPAITASIGVALSAESKNSLNELIACADEALYRAKDSGRDYAEYIELVSPAESDAWL